MSEPITLAAAYAAFAILGWGISEATHHLAWRRTERAKDQAIERRRV